MLVVALMLLQSHVERAQTLLREQRLSEAQEAVSAALREEPDSVPALAVQGRLAMAINDFDLARSSFERAARLAPESARALFLLGFFHYVDNDFVRARSALEAARKLGPDDPRNTLFLALTYEGLAQLERAEPLFKEALLRPTVEAHVAYARMLLSNGRLDEAQRQITRALVLDPNAREPLYEQARLDLETGRISECISHAERALTRSGEGVTERQIHFLLSRAYTKAGDTVRARLHRQQFEAVPPRLIR